MYVASPHHGGSRIALDSCAGTHTELMWRCPPEAFACHVGTLGGEPDIYQGPNRVLAFIDYLRGSEPLARVDLADVDDAYRPGERLVTLHKNDALFQDDDWFVQEVYVLTQRDGAEVTCYVSAFADEEAARRSFAAAIEP